MEILDINALTPAIVRYETGIRERSALIYIDNKNKKVYLPWQLSENYIDGWDMFELQLQEACKEKLFKDVKLNVPEIPKDIPGA